MSSRQISLASLSTLSLEEKKKYSELESPFLYMPVFLPQTKQNLLKSFCKGWSFPHHFGYNYDAFNDCLRDLVPQTTRTPQSLTFSETKSYVLEVDAASVDWNALKMLVRIMMEHEEECDKSTVLPKLILAINNKVGPMKEFIASLPEPIRSLPRYDSSKSNV